MKYRTYQVVVSLPNSEPVTYTVLAKDVREAKAETIWLYCGQVRTQLFRYTQVKRINGE